MRSGLPSSTATTSYDTSMASSSGRSRSTSSGSTSSSLYIGTITDSLAMASSLRVSLLLARAHKLADIRCSDEAHRRSGRAGPAASLLSTSDDGPH